MEWEQLLQIKMDNKMQFVGRDPKIQKLYDQNKKEILSKFQSMEDYIFIEVFECPPEFTKSGKIKAAIKPNEKSIVLTPNRYPYNIKAFHFIIWLGSKNIELSIDKIQKLLPFEFHGRPFFIHENSRNNKTIKNIEHIHVFVK